MGGLNLDLSGAKESSFDALPSGWYPATILDVEMKPTKGGPTAKLPAGTPMLNVQFRIADGHEFENRRQFRSYVIAPDKVEDKETGKKVNNENKKTTDGILYGFLKAAGFDPDEIKSGKFQLDFDEVKGRAVQIKLGQREKRDASGAVVKDENGNPEMQNEVKDVKAMGNAPVGAGDDLGLLG